MTDFRHALRTIWRTPALSATVIFTVALAIGVNTAIFSVVNAVILRRFVAPRSLRDCPRDDQKLAVVVHVGELHGADRARERPKIDLPGEAQREQQEPGADGE
jgi:hypothetical protein